MNRKQKSSNMLLNMHPLQRVLISIVFSAIVYFVTRPADFNGWLTLLILWVAFAFSFLITSWIVLLKRSTSQIRNIASGEDGTKIFVLAAILIASFASMGAVLVIIVPKGAGNAPEGVYLPVGLAAMILSWIMVHTTLAFHYAHLYYNPSKNTVAKIAGGLEFPDDDDPGYLDFAYFSFVIGMTFQVSDVQVMTPGMRRVVLWHSLLAFALNTFVVALTINVVAGLTKAH